MSSRNGRLALSLLWLWACRGDEPADVMPESDAAVDAGAQGPEDAGHDAGREPDAGLPPDPCGEVTTAGRCVDESTLEVCVVPTGAAARELQQFACADDEVCDDQGAMAACVRVDRCREGEARCADETTLEICDGNDFVSTPCPRACLSSALGDLCAADVATRTLSGEARYELRGPNETFDDWTTSASEAQARGFLVLSYHGDELVDAVETQLDSGAFTLQVAEPASDVDALVLVAAAAGPGGALSYAVADAGYPAAATPRGLFDTPPDPRIWSWSFPVSETLHVSEAMGSGAAHVFDTLRAVTTLADVFYAPEQPRSVVAWLGIGTAWQCGACMARSPVRVFDVPFERQLWFDGSGDEGYWSSAVTAHELGHYVMSAHGFEPGEGGPHFLGFRTNPGQAYSEGFATFFSSAMRADTRYYDKQDGAFFWWDIDLRSYAAADTVWQRAEASQGLEQLMDENEVAALLHHTYVALGSLAPVLSALNSPRLLGPSFARGYLERSWSDPEHPEQFSESDRPHPYLADFYDALLCADAISRESLDRVNEPNVHYPYPSEAPLCD